MSSSWEHGLFLRSRNKARHEVPVIHNAARELICLPEHLPLAVAAHGLWTCTVEWSIVRSFAVDYAANGLVCQGGQNQIDRFTSMDSKAHKICLIRRELVLVAHC